MSDNRHSSRSFGHSSTGSGLPQETLKTGLCSAKCAFFKCGRKAIQPRGQTVWCVWIGDTCTGSSCSFAQCIRGKMIAQNRCGLMIHRITSDVISPEDFKLDLKLPGKLTRRLGDDKELV